MNDTITRTFHDIETASQTLSAFWDVELLQASQGIFRIDLNLASVGRCLVYDVRTEVGLVAGGQRSDQFVTISPITTDCSSSRFRGRELEPNQLLIMEPGGDVFQQLASGHRQAAVSIPADLFRRVAMAEFAADDRVNDLRVNDLIAWQTLATQPAKFGRFRRAIAAILRGDRPRSSTTAINGACSELLENLDLLTKVNLQLTMPAPSANLLQKPGNDLSVPEK